MAAETGVVMDGRDIGTVVLPNADVKLFVTADIETRTARRWLELNERGTAVSQEAVKENLQKRDHLDSTRSDSPLKMADDALLLDTSGLDRAEMLAEAVRLIYQKTSK